MTTALERNEYGWYLCPLLDHEQVGWNEATDERVWKWVPCRAILHVEQSTSGILTSPVDEAPDEALTSAWEVTCENGHTLARSGGEEDAEPFDFGAWIESLGASPAQSEGEQG